LGSTNALGNIRLSKTGNRARLENLVEKRELFIEPFVFGFNLRAREGARFKFFMCELLLPPSFAV